MKLRNIFLAGLAVCTMASCSKDETIDYSQMGEVDAYVSFAATSVVSTKADDTEMKANENYINSLTAYVFYKGETDAESKLAGIKHLTVDKAEAGLVKTTGLTGIDHIIVKVTPTADGKSSNDQFVAVLVANADQKNVSTLKALKEEVITSGVENYTVANVAGKKCYLPMASGEISFSGLIPNVIKDGETNEYTENWLNCSENPVAIKKETSSDGDPTTVPTGLGEVMLTRLVARVQVESVKVNIVNNYPGAKFTLKHLSLVNVHPTATISDGAGGYVKGYQSDGYSDESAKAWIFPNSEKVQTLVKEYNLALDEDKETSAPDGKTWKDADDKFCTYIFANPENAEYQTALLISGMFYKNEADKKGTEKHFRIFLQDTEHQGPIMVLSNYVYKLNVQITGEGSPNENEILLNAHVAAKIDVAPWNVIEQNESDAN